VYITGDMTGDPWQILPMANTGDHVYSFSTRLTPFTEGAYFFLNDSSGAARENVPDNCAAYLQTDRMYYIPNHDTTIGYFWSSCDQITLSAENIRTSSYKLSVFPNPSAAGVTVIIPDGFNCRRLQVVDFTGHVILEEMPGNNIHEYHLDLSVLRAGIYLLYLAGDKTSLYSKLIKK